jgi:hypothetical protein
VDARHPDAGMVAQMSLFIGPRGMLKRKPPGYAEKCAQLRKELTAQEAGSQALPKPLGEARIAPELASPPVELWHMRCWP